MKWRLVINYILAENKHNQRSFLIGTSTVFVIVLFLSLIQNSLTRSNLIFVRLAENSVGAFDYLVSADFSLTQTPFVNYTLLSQLSKPLEDSVILGSCARWILRANASQSDGPSVSSVILIVNSTREFDIGISRLWPHRTLGNGECHVSSSLLRALDVRPLHGEEISLNVNLLSAQQQTGLAASQNQGSSGNGLVAPDPTPTSTTGQNQTQATTTTTGSTTTPSTVSFPSAFLGALSPTARQQILGPLNATVENGTVTFRTDNLQALFAPGGPAQLQVNCTVIDPIDETFGVYPPSLGNVVYIEQSFAEQIAQSNLATFYQLFQLSQANSTQDRASILFGGGGASELESFRMEDYAMLAVFMLQNRYDIYNLASDARKSTITAKSNEIMSQVGLNFPISMIDVVNQTLQLSSLIQIFLNEIFFTIMTVLVVLAVILIASLLMSDAEEKTFEYGMLRMLGLESHNIVLLLVVQSLIYSIPGVIVGLLICYMLYLPVGFYISTAVGSVVDTSFTASAIALGITAGLVLPVFGTVLPIRRALAQTIRNSLDMYHNAVFDTTLSVKRLENVGLSLNQTVVAVLLVVVGFIVYYLIPLAFTFGKLDMFFRIMTVILLGMIVGLVLLAQIIEPYLSRLAVEIVTWIGFDKSITAVVVKNMNAHAPRNRKTSVMFTLCLGYIVFASTMFSLQIRSFAQNIEWYLGSDIVVTGPSYTTPLPEDKLRSYLDSILYNASNIKADNVVVSYSFVSYPLNQMPSVSKASIGRLSPVRMPTLTIYGIEKNFMDVALTQYLNPSEVSGVVEFPRLSDGSYDLVAALFQNLTSTAPVPTGILTNAIRQQSLTFGNNRTLAYQKSLPILLSASVADSGTISAQDKLITNVFHSVGQRSYQSTPVALLKKMPGFPNINRLVVKNTPAFVSMPNFKSIMNDVQNSTLQPLSDTVPKGFLYIKLISGVTSLQIQALVNGLNSLIENDRVTVVDLRTQVSNTQAASSLINIVFNLVALVGVVLSFFVLLLSFTANVRENSWQLGVLRAIGLTGDTVIKIFIYEALGLVIACIILGLFLGILTGVTVTLQSNLFSELPFTMDFPISLFLLTVASSFILAIFGSYVPISEFNQKPIALALKGQ